MGLDMYVYRINKPKLEDRVYTTDEIIGAGLSYVLTKETEDEIQLITELLPYTITRDVICQFYDREKMIVDYNLPDDSYIGMYSPEGIALYGTRNGEGVSQFISREDVKTKYTLTETRPCYIWNAEEVYYWRKAYDIQDWIYSELFYEVQNCGYYELDGELISRLNAEFDEEVPVEDPTNEHALFYHEWY
jgi:hypothetical protein